ncbi:hypothetical protein MTR_5g033630 [Medicago truncatula]|uniref:Uncharacterized protein n=1 Tax=Medicago truncatula TaxID=3880 RepID=G7K052_MEDTR|nr:hypothetical protein MTR_5g033630 [Medicago truncatula]
MIFYSWSSLYIDVREWRDEDDDDDNHNDDEEEEHDEESNDGVYDIFEAHLFRRT